MLLKPLSAVAWALILEPEVRPPSIVKGPNYGPEINQIIVLTTILIRI